MELVKKIRPKNPKKIKTILNNKIIKQKTQKKNKKQMTQRACHKLYPPWHPLIFNLVLAIAFQSVFYLKIH